MTKEEADFLLHHLKFYLADEGFVVCAIEAERTQERIKHLTSQQAKEYANFVLPPGKRGRVRLVLYQPYEARGYVLIAAILKNIEEKK